MSNGTALAEEWRPWLMRLERQLDATMASKSKCKRDTAEFLAGLALAMTEHDKTTAIVLREMNEKLAALTKVVADLKGK